MKYAMITMLVCLVHSNLFCSESRSGSKIRKTPFGDTIGKLITAHDTTASGQSVLPGCEKSMSLSRPAQFGTHDHRAMTLGLQAMIRQAELESVNKESGSYQILCALYEAFKNEKTSKLMTDGAAGSSGIIDLLATLDNTVLSKLREDELYKQSYEIVLKTVQELRNAIKAFTRDAAAVKALKALSEISNIKSLPDLNGNDSHKRMHEANSHLDPKSSDDLDAMLLLVLTLRHNRAMCVESPEFNSLLVPDSLQQAAQELGIDRI